MELRNVYIVIFLVGLVFAILSITSNYGTNSAITVLFLTIALILLIQLAVEYRYYRSYKAPLAAGIFLLIPSALALGGSYVSRLSAINGQPFLADYLASLTLNISFSQNGPIVIFLNIFSILSGLFYIGLLVLLYRYYTGIYPRLFLMRKKFYKQFAMYYNIALIAIIAFFWLSTNTIELFELLFVIVSIIFIIRTYVFKVVLVPVRAVPSRQRRTPQRRAYTSPNATSTTPTRSLSQPSRPSQPQRLTQPSQTFTTTPAHTPARPPTPIHTPAPVRTQARPAISHSASAGSIEVVDGIPLGTSAKHSKASKINVNNVKEMIPVAQNLTQDDFRCIFCYELPIKPSDQVVICPNCKKPAHYPEYQKWTAYSNFCSYCNQDIGNKTPKRVSGKNYKNIIAYALKK